MGTVNTKFTVGWYGSLHEGDCTPFDLTPVKDQICAVYQISADGTGDISYSPAMDNLSFNGFNELACGFLYRIVLKDGSSGFSIEGFVPSEFYSDTNTGLSEDPSGYILKEPATINITSLTVTSD
jgi:hypothetical protein